ncbi:hydrolase 2, exosortase A system-associated [Roseateles sp. GG27B]
MTRSQPFFLARGEDGGQRFCIFHPPQGGCCGRVLHIHAFAEEMNKSRRMAALQSQALAKAGFAVLQIDLLGCGDSSGDFGDAGWQEWLADLDAAADWLNANAAVDSPLWLWGHRVGCLLAVELAQRRPDPCNFIFWQPPASGKLLLQQFLRLKIAGDMLGGKAAGAMDTLKKQLAAGESVEIAGYALSPALACGLEVATLTPPKNSTHAIWMELSAQPGTLVSPVMSALAQQWSVAGVAVKRQTIQGPLFWQTSEIEDAPALLPATLSAMRAVHA